MYQSNKFKILHDLNILCRSISMNDSPVTTHADRGDHQLFPAQFYTFYSILICFYLNLEYTP